ncbi:MAG: hypothetical protein O3B47_01480 [bacterium]|nr:hypothetical protein [bacterium]
MDKDTFMSTLEVGEKLGSGAESNCYLMDNGEDPKTVVKVPNWFGRVWQTQSAEYIRECLRILGSLDIKHIKTRIHEEADITIKGKERRAKIATETKYIEDMDYQKIRYRDLVDPTMGPELIEALSILVEKADKIFHAHHLGLDLYGGAIVVDVLRGIYQSLLLQIAKVIPPVAKMAQGIKGQIRNVIQEEDGELLLVDTGMHDLRARGKFKFITRNLHHLLTASLIEVLKRANSQLPQEEQVLETELKALPFNGRSWHQKLSKALLKMMIPLFERYDAIEAGELDPKKAAHISIIPMV